MVETQGTVDELLTIVRGRVENVLEWWRHNPAGVVPSLVVRADMLCIAAGFAELDERLTHGEPMPRVWQRDSERPVLRSAPEDISWSVVEDFSALVTPVSVPTERHAARQMLSEWLVNHVEPIPSEPLRWMMRLVDNGFYVVETNGQGMVVSVRYEVGL